MRAARSKFIGYAGYVFKFEHDDDSVKIVATPKAGGADIVISLRGDDNYIRSEAAYVTLIQAVEEKLGINNFFSE